MLRRILTGWRFGKKKLLNVHGTLLLQSVRQGDFTALRISSQMLMCGLILLLATLLGCSTCPAWPRPYYYHQSSHDAFCIITASKHLKQNPLGGLETSDAR